MIKIKQAILVEGKYDAIKLSNFVDALILTTEGFGIFKNKEKQNFLRRIAKEKGLIVLTDSDSAGFMIRNFISSCVPDKSVINVYIPDIYGKEKRKTHHSAEGKLGVEGVSEEVIINAFEKAGVASIKTTKSKREITNIDLFEYGLSGRPNSAMKRKLLFKKLGLPERLSASALVKVLNAFVTYEEFENIIKDLDL